MGSVLMNINIVVLIVVLDVIVSLLPVFFPEVINPIQFHVACLYVRVSMPVFNVYTDTQESRLEHPFSIAYLIHMSYI